MLRRTRRELEWVRFLQGSLPLDQLNLTFALEAVCFLALRNARTGANLSTASTLV